MCTLTHLKTPEGYLIYFNRDEQKTRPKSLPPITQEKNGLKITMPIDPQSSGTWLATNSNGLTIALLNAYTPQRYLDTNLSLRQSRGKIIPKLIQNPTLETTLQEIQSTDFSNYEEFSLVLFSLNALPHLIDYRNGELIHTQNPEFPISSSGHNPKEVIPHRKKIYKEIVGNTPTEKTLHKFHYYQDPKNTPYSVRMERKDAKTESIIKLTQTPKSQTLKLNHT